MPFKELFAPFQSGMMLRLVFRTDGDSNKKRTSNTPSPDVMLRNIVHEWKDVKSGSGKNLFTLDTLQAIEKLKRHITAGCLSNTP